ncbi:hypothetical protein ACHHRT_05490 [Desulfurivibrio sp. D14AmB]|uniref:hypothetical protein n=1 Tax=Desulfurivibrio sp. D14AmB TaxID=3374370 RepID=UPI00376ED1AA
MPPKNLGPATFFTPAENPWPELFPPELPVWEGLRRLKEYLEGQSYTTLPESFRATAGPLAETLVYFREGESGDCRLLAGSECEINYLSPTKGQLEVRHRGQRLEGAGVLMAGTVLMGRQIQLGRGVLVEAGAFLKGPLVIGDQSEIRQGAYLRGHCLIGSRCVVGHVTEVKNSIFMNDAKAGHFAYIGDSILGPESNLGAGTKLANLRFLGGSVQIRHESGSIDSGLKKLGAILGSGCQTGCNSVTNPGTLLGKGCFLLPNTTAPTGYHSANTVIRP